jgi:predicted secreted hydrolase
VWPRDHGAHNDSRIEWWYATGWLVDEAPGAQTPPRWGFQVTFFRTRTGLADDLTGRLAPRHLLFAHAALSTPALKQHDHAQRIARWSGETNLQLRNRASSQDADVHLEGWHFVRRGPLASSRFETRVEDPAFALELTLQSTQPLLLQGDAGFSQKGPQQTQASHYVSAVQLAVSGQIRHQGQLRRVRGRAWFDHEWSDTLLHPDAVGWDWVGINLADGSALTAFQLRRADGSALWAGGSWRPATGKAEAFAPQAVRFKPQRRWRSAATQAEYPVVWMLETPAGQWTVSALMDAQELDGRGSTGTVYWEGLCALEDTSAQVLGWGYLEMTGYAGRLQLSP